MYLCYQLPFPLDLIRTHSSNSIGCCNWGAQGVLALPLGAAFPDIASPFGCLLCRKALNVRLFNKNSLWRSDYILETSCHFRNHWCSFSARSLIKKAWASPQTDVSLWGYETSLVLGWKRETLSWKRCQWTRINNFIPCSFPKAPRVPLLVNPHQELRSR